MPHRNLMQMVSFYSDKPRESIPWKLVGGEQVFPNSVFQPLGFRGYCIFKTSFLSGHLVFIKFQ
ncbi:hypothetical protein BDN67DRAFT_976049 [Paxillus ammoniavirescens]|nr:hypothetical protein BDN67DRAFT_976049 [Paxillus ammoniavirescens]